MKNLVALAQKSEGSILHNKIIKELGDRCLQSKSGILSFKDVRRVLSWHFHLGKDESWCLFKELEFLGLCEIVPYHGIRIRKEVRE
jgi:hypothetical protein